MPSARCAGGTWCAIGPARRIPGPRAWPIWELPRWVAFFVILVVLTDAVVLAVEASKVQHPASMTSRCSPGC